MVDEPRRYVAKIDPEVLAAPPCSGLSAQARLLYLASIFQSARYGRTVIPLRDMRNVFAQAGMRVLPEPWDIDPQVQELFSTGLWVRDLLSVKVRGDYFELSEAVTYPLPPREIWSRIQPYLSPFVFQLDNYACVVCGAKDDITVDHIIPLSRGGSNDFDNLQTLCRSCNSRKGAR